MGDGLLAVFGREAGLEAGARAALAASRRIDLALDSLNQQLGAEVGGSIGIGIGILHCARGLHGGNGTAFLQADRVADRLGAKLIQARARCYRALKSTDRTAFEAALALLAECGADAEVLAFRQLDSSHERPA